MSTAPSNDVRSVIAGGAEGLGVALDARQLDAFDRLIGLLLEWNERMNLTAVRDPTDIAVKHVIDSLTCLNAYSFPEDASVIDVGAGAGFPGLVLKIARPDLRITLLDSTRKKLGFVDHVIDAMRWHDAQTLARRAEEAGQDRRYREQFDVAVARAVAAMRLLVEFCLPLVRMDGVMLAMKGPALDIEMALADTAIAALGGEALDPIPFTLPLGGGERAIVPIRKVFDTPSILPRLFRDMKRQPL